MSELATMAALKITNSINQHYQQQYQEEQLTPPSHNPPIQFPAGSATTPSSDTSSQHTSSHHTSNMNTNTSSSVAIHDCSPDVSDTLSQQTMSPTTTTHTPTNNSRSSRQTSIEAAGPSSSIDNDDMAIDHSLSSSTSIHSNNSFTNNQFNKLNNISTSTTNIGTDDIDGSDSKSIGSVLEKLSLFERMEQRLIASANANANPNIPTGAVPIYGVGSASGARKIEDPISDPGMRILFCFPNYFFY